MEGKFVEFRFTCPCGTNLTVHCQHIPGGHASVGRYAVICPKCDKEHVMPAPVRRFLYQNAGEDHWEVGPQRNVI